jgi:DNA-binding transcriptional MerR regulator
VADDGYLRIGELSRRVGVSPELLRAWERRYALLQPSRSAGRFRLYSDADIARVRAMKASMEQGLSAAEAARHTLASNVATAVAERGAAPLAGELAEGVAELREALESFDDGRAHVLLDGFLATFSLDSVLRDVILPTLREIGDRWARQEVSVAQEHFASNLLRGRLLALARGWGRGGGPRALLAAPAGELHDLGLIIFGLALRDRGWTITFLGADTPVSTIVDTTRRVAPDVVVIAALDSDRWRSENDELAALSKAGRLALAGAGASPALAARLGAEHLDEDPLDAAERLAASR